MVSSLLKLGSMDRYLPFSAQVIIEVYFRLKLIYGVLMQWLQLVSIQMKPAVTEPACFQSISNLDLVESIPLSIQNFDSNQIQGA